MQAELRPYYTVTMDWIVALLETRDRRDSLLTTTCKSTKRVVLTPGRTDWSAQQ